MKEGIESDVLRRFATAIITIAQKGGFSTRPLAAFILEAEEQEGVNQEPKSETASFSFLPVHVSLLGEMLSHWRQSENYTNKLGEVKTLPRNGGTVSLESLFHEVLEDEANSANGMTFDMAFERLMLHGIIAAQDDGTYKQTKKHFTFALSKGNIELSVLNYLAEFAETMAENMGRDEGMFHRVARAKRFPRAKIPIIRSILEEQGMEFLTEVDELMNSERSADGKPDEDVVNIGIGMYLFQTTIE